MSAPVRTVFRMSSSAAHRLDCYGQVEVNFFKTGLPLRIIGIKRQVWPKQARRTAEWLTNAGSGRPRTARQLRILSAGAITRATPPSAGKRAIAVRICLGTRCAASAPGFSPHDRAGGHRGRSGHQGACPHAPPCLRLQARQRLPRHARDPGVSGSSQHPKYDALYRAGAAAVQGIFSRLKRDADRNREGAASAGWWCSASASPIGNMT